MQHTCVVCLLPRQTKGFSTLIASSLGLAAFTRENGLRERSSARRESRRRGGHLLRACRLAPPPGTVTVRKTRSTQ